MLKAAGVEALIAETEGLVGELVGRDRRARDGQRGPPGGRRAHRGATYVKDAVLPAMDAVREVADRLENVVADDLWPLPKYSEILFVK